MGWGPTITKWRGRSIASVRPAMPWRIMKKTARPRGDPSLRCKEGLKEVLLTTHRLFALPTVATGVPPVKANTRKPDIQEVLRSYTPSVDKKGWVPMSCCGGLTMVPRTLVWIVCQVSQKAILLRPDTADAQEIFYPFRVKVGRHPTRIAS